MRRWRAAAVAAAVAVAAGCAPPPSPVASWYDASTDTIYYDPAWMAQIRAWYGQAGVDWVVAHEEGHRTSVHLWREQGIALWDWMPGATLAVRLEQTAQCVARVRIGAPEPWVRPPDQVERGYWPCDDGALQARVAAAIG